MTVRIIAERDTGTIHLMSKLHSDHPSVKPPTEGEFVIFDPVITVSTTPNDPAVVEKLFTTELESDSPLFNGINVDELLKYKPEHCYILDAEKGLRRRPWFQLSRVEDVPIPSLVKINTPFTLRIEYMDPDNVGFFDKITSVKFKDRQSLVDTSDFSILDFSKDKSVEVILQSSYPGLSIFRAKDTGYLCKVGTFQIKYTAT